jgi:hypothetical protein
MIQPSDPDVKAKANTNKLTHKKKLVIMIRVETDDE